MSRRLALAALALGLLALPACGGGEDGGGTPEAELPATETGAIPPGGFAEDQVEIALENAETADMIGTAVLTPEDEETTRIVIFLDVFPEDGVTAEIREGGCADASDRVLHDLGPLENGQGDTTVDVPLEQLLAQSNSLVALDTAGQRLGCAIVAPFGAVDE